MVRIKEQSNNYQYYAKVHSCTIISMAAGDVLHVLSCIRAVGSTEIMMGHTSVLTS